MSSLCEICSLDEEAFTNPGRFSLPGEQPVLSDDGQIRCERRSNLLVAREASSPSLDDPARPYGRL